MLDPGSHPRPSGVAPANMGGHRLTARLSALELRNQSAPVEQPQIGLRAKGGIGPHAARQIVAVAQPAKFSAVWVGGMGHGETPHKPVRTVDANMVLVTEGRDHDLARRALLAVGGDRALPILAALQRPAAIAVDLSAAARLPPPRPPATLDRLLLGLREPRPARLDDRRVDDLAAHRQVPALPQHPVEPSE